MTVCIGAKAKEQCLVLATDTKITTGHYSAEAMSLKAERLHPHWYALLAGKISRRPPVISSVANALRGKTPSRDEVAEACKNAYISLQRDFAYERVLSPYGLTWESFQGCRNSIGDSLFERLWSEVSHVEVGFDMLVGGHDQRGIAHIFTVSQPTDEFPSFINYAEDTEFACIGSGGYLADSTLYAVSQGPHCDVNRTTYNVAVAKFVAESASDVGDMTLMRILWPDGTVKRFEVNVIDQELRKEWREYGMPKIRPQAALIIERGIQAARILHQGESITQSAAQSSAGQS